MEMCYIYELESVLSEKNTGVFDSLSWGECKEMYFLTDSPCENT